MAGTLNKTVLWGRMKSLIACGVISCSAALAHGAVNDRPFFQNHATVIVFGASDFNDTGGTAPVVFDFLTLEEGVSGQAAPDLIELDGRTINFNNGNFNAIFSNEAGGLEFEINNAVSGGEFNSVAPNQILNAADSYNAFELDEDTDVDLLGGANRSSRFFVASNVPFDIYAHSDNLQTTGTFDALDLSNIRYRLRVQVRGGGGVNRWGTRAQDPSVGGQGIILPQNQATRLDAISAGPTKVFDGGQATAASPGGIIQQAVSFQSRYNLLSSGLNGNNYDFSLGAGSIAADVTYTIYVP